MSDSLWFESLADIYPGNCTLKDATCRWGTPQVSESSDGGLFFTFPEHGVRVSVASNSMDNPQAIVEEVAIIPPYGGTLPCSIGLGHPKLDALRVIRQSYLIADEYEDAVYFRPSCNPQLLASVEFMEKDVVVLIELMHYSS
jgi:hypothetical protein